MKEIYAFKIVRRRKRGLESLMAWPPILYKKENWAKPWNGWGPLTAFESLGAAKNFMSSYVDKALEEWEVWLVRGEKSPKNMVWAENLGEWADLEALPRGTVLMDRVKMVARVM